MGKSWTSEWHSKVLPCIFGRGAPCTTMILSLSCNCSTSNGLHRKVALELLTNKLPPGLIREYCRTPARGRVCCLCLVATVPHAQKARCRILGSVVLMSVQWPDQNALPSSCCADQQGK